MSFIDQFFMATLFITLILGAISTFVLFFTIIYIRFISVFIYTKFRDNEKLKVDLFRAYSFLRKHLEIPEDMQVDLKLKMPRGDSLCQGYIEKNLLLDKKAGQVIKPIFDIVIFLNSNTDNIFDVLSHEMVHLQQYAHGKLDSNSVTRYWNGSIFDETNVDYEDLPWEKEAFARQEELTNLVYFRLLGKEIGTLHKIARFIRKIP
jgi:hypothetical protein